MLNTNTSDKKKLNKELSELLAIFSILSVYMIYTGYHAILLYRRAHGNMDAWQVRPAIVWAVIVLVVWLYYALRFSFSCAGVKHGKKP